MTQYAGHPRDTSLRRHGVKPLLLERLTDNEPESLHDPAGFTLDSPQALRGSVLANLRALFNCTNFGDPNSLRRWPHIGNSTLNYGLPPLAGKVISELTWQEIDRALAQAIADFEPRIVQADLRIGRASQTLALAPHNILTFTLRGTLRWSPAPLDFIFASRVDLESGHFELAEER